jgi:RNA polymerase sigma factor (sigma-70 family)
LNITLKPALPVSSMLAVMPMIPKPTESAPQSNGDGLEKQMPETDAFLFKTGMPQAGIDAVVWAALQQGHRKALDYIFEKHIRLLYAYGARITADVLLVEDCIQDIFVELWKRHERLSATDSIKFYLLKCLRRNIERKLAVGERERARHVHAAEYMDGHYASAESQLIELQTMSEQQQQLSRALKKLSQRQREAVYLKFYEKMPYEQLAEVLHIDLKSTYKLIGKAVESLRKLIKLT